LGGLVTMVGDELQSIVLASDYRVDDVEQMWALFEGRRARLAGLGVHRLVVYTSIWQPGRVMVTAGIRRRRSAEDLLRTTTMLEWFDLAGVVDIPAVFAGQVVEKLDLHDTPIDPAVPGVIVGVTAPVRDVGVLMHSVHSGLDRFRQAGIRKVWVYQALDDGHEVMILQEVDNETSVRRWIDHPDTAAEWMSAAGFGAYPPIFVGRLAHILSLDELR
jgi:hypothetical protein